MKKTITGLLNRNDINITRPQKQIRNKKNNIIRRFNLKESNSVELFFKSFDYINKMNEHLVSISIIKEETDYLIVKFNEYYVKIESVEDIYIISEVLIDKDYNFLSNEEYVFFDIGFNIGITSLVFSNKKNISKIYGYEPVSYTYEIACENINLNKITKIELQNIGLGGFTRKETFKFNKNFKGNVGLRGNNSYSINKLDEADKNEIIVQILDISSELDRIISKHPKQKIAMKIDCEGAEYEILEKLDQQNKFVNIDVLMIEWHDKGPQSIEEILIKNKYRIFSRTLETNSGMIYATR